MTCSSSPRRRAESFKSSGLSRSNWGSIMVEARLCVPRTESTAGRAKRVKFAALLRQRARDVTQSGTVCLD